MAYHPYDLDTLHIPTLGLVVLQTDETIEHDFRRLLSADECKLHVSRVVSGADLTPEMIARMDRALPEAASLLPPAASFDAVAYACTSGTAHIGAERVHQVLRTETGATSATDPMTAAIAALGALGAHRIGVLTPYTETIAQPLIDTLRETGFDVTSSLSFGEEVEANVVRISGNSVRGAVEALLQGAEVDAVFMSCTNLRTLDVIPDLETRFGIPVFGSNLALAWHLSKLAGLGALRLPTRLASV